MKYYRFCLFLTVLLAGCAYNQYQQDVAENVYDQTQIHADPSAAYVGAWSTVFKTGTRTIKIKEDGRIKVCLTPSSGVTYGKVYLEKQKPAFMLQTGAKAKILAMDKEFLLLEIYGKQEKYYAVPVPDECAPALKQF